MAASVYRKVMRVASASSRRRPLEPMQTGTTVQPMRMWLGPVVLHVTMRRARSDHGDHVCGVACTAQAGRHTSGEKGKVASHRRACMNLSGSCGGLCAVAQVCIIGDWWSRTINRNHLGEEGSTGRPSRSCVTRYGTRGPGSQADRNARTNRHGLLAGDDGASHRRRPSP